MTDSVLPSAIYQPQQIPVTAYYVAQEGDAERFARSLATAGHKAMAPALGFLLAAAGVYGLIVNGVEGLLAMLFYGSLGLIIAFPISWLHTRRRMQRYCRATTQPGERSCSRFGPEEVDFESERACITLRYEDLLITRVTSEVVVFGVGDAAAMQVVPRALVPDDILAWLRSRARTKGKRSTVAS